MVRINQIISKGLNLADDMGGQSIRNWRKPKAFNGLRFAPHATADVFKASGNIDYLSADFIKSLLKIEGKTKIETATMIKDEILKAMKYKKPSTLILTESPNVETPASFILAEGKIRFGQKLDPDTKEMLIAILYHELDHMDKFVKLYKALGEKSFETLIKKDIPASQQHKYQWNKEFYKIMSKDVSLAGFNVNRYKRAVSKYKNFDLEDFYDSFMYFQNPLEKDAFALTKKVLTCFEKKYTLAHDSFNDALKMMRESLDDINPEGLEMKLQVLYRFAKLNSNK